MATFSREPIISNSFKLKCLDIGFFRKGHQEAIRVAEEHGYFLAVSSSLLFEELSKHKPDNIENVSKNLENIKSVQLINRRIRNISEIGFCTRLTVLNLAGNFISFIDTLVSCVRLVKLDLHGNQISQLPGRLFWKEMKQLRILHLQDNPLSQFSSIDGLIVCPALSILTLSDTPLSLKSEYRHHIVNTVCSLQVLDKYIISDGEIIDGAKLGGRFAAFSQPFQINPCYESNGSYKDEWHLIWSMIGRVNYILSHHSPVLIIQRYTRGYFVRKALKLFLDLQLWAAIYIQRWYRALKYGKFNSKALASPPPTPAISDRLVHLPLTSGRDSMKLDCDTYLKNLCHGSTCFNDLASTQSRLTRHGKENRFSSSLKPIVANRLNILSKEVLVDVDKLQSSILGHLPSNECREADQCLQTANYKNTKYIIKRPDQRNTNGKKHEKRFPNQEAEEVISMMDSEVDDSRFRLQGIKMDVKHCNLVKELRDEMVKTAKEIHCLEEIRCGELRHVVTPVAKRNILLEIQDQKRTKQESVIWLACLNAVGHDFKRAEMAEKMEEKFARVRRMKEQRDSAKSRISLDLEDHRRSLSFVNDVEQRSILEDLHLLKLQQMNLALSYKKARTTSAELEKRRRKDLAFAREFVFRTATCSKASFRFGEEELREERYLKKKSYVNEKRAETSIHHRMLKRFLAERQQVMQDVNSIEKKALNEQILRREKERHAAIKNHVDALKQIHRKNVTDGKNHCILLKLPVVSSKKDQEEMTVQV